MSTETERITALEARQAELERRIAELERQALEQVERSVPWTWPVVNPVYPDPTYPRPVIVDPDPRCPVCNNRYADMSHYVCSHPQCPSRITYTAHSLGQTPAHLSYPAVSAETPEHLKGTTLPPQP